MSDKATQEYLEYCEENGLPPIESIDIHVESIELADILIDLGNRIKSGDVDDNYCLTDSDGKSVGFLTLNYGEGE